MGSTAAPAVVGRALEANIGRAQAPHNTIVSVTVITDTTTDPIVSAINPADTTTLFTDTVTDPTDTVTLLTLGYYLSPLQGFHLVSQIISPPPPSAFAWRRRVGRAVRSCAG